MFHFNPIVSKTLLNGLRNLTERNILCSEKDLSNKMRSPKLNFTNLNEEALNEIRVIPGSRQVNK